MTALHLPDILSAIPPDHPWRSSIYCFDAIDSTNTRAKQLAAAGAPHGTVLIADSQAGGRGRMGRSFHSPGGLGIYLSVILRPECPPAELMHLTCAAAVAMCDAVESETGIRPGIKWTNDLVIGRKKLAGILTELAIAPESGKIAYAVVGIGINCCHTPEDFPAELKSIATSLSMEWGNPIHRNRLCAAMIASLSQMDAMLLSHKAQIMDAYRANCVTLGKQVSVVRGEEIRHAVALDVDADGALLVRYESGETAAVSSGEVSIRGMYGYV